MEEVSGDAAEPEKTEQVAVDLEAAIVVDGPPPGAGEGCEKPPDYESLEVVDGVNLPRQSNTLVAEAPPAYHQLFGRGKSSTPRRPHTRPRGSQTQPHSDHDQSLVSRLRARYPRLSKYLIRLTVVCAILSLIGLSTAMVIIGSVNINQCSSFAVPVYLIVAGILMMIEVTFHATLWLLMKRSDNNSLFRALRIFDCVAFILLVWLLIGSNWIFKLSIAGSSPCDTAHPIDDVIYLNTTVVTDGAGGTRWIVVTETHGSTPITTCHDCSTRVYQFTVMVILMQYIAALLIIVGCCSKIFKK